MKRLNLAGVLAVPVFLLASMGAKAALVPWSTELTPDQEPHEIVGLNGDEMGSASGMLDTELGELTWDLQWSGLTGPAFAAHFHDAPPGEAGPIEVPMFMLEMGEGTTDGQNMGSAIITSEQIAELLAGEWYVNVHTPDNPAGEIRGQVMASVPGPGAMILLSLGLLALVLTRRKSI
jgi:hypothetical protein